MKGLNSENYGNISQSALLLNKQNELQEVDLEFERLKVEHRHRITECEKRRQTLEHKQNHMKEQVSKFEKFVKENDAKKQRAEVKASVEKKLSQEKTKQIKSMSDDLSNQRKSLKELQSLVSKFDK
jgi:hypothetical protein